MNRLLECFVVCAEELNFSHAAKKLHISQQALSSSIQKLEKEYQVQLFERKPRVKLTEAGRQLLIRAKYILSAEEELRTTLSGLSDSASGSITIGSSVLRARMFMPSLWPSYHSQYPKVHVALKTSSSSLMTDELLDGDIDLYIGQCYQTLPAFKVQLLAEEPSFFIASLELLKQYISKETILDLQLRTAEGIFLEDLFRLADFPYILVAETRARKNMDHYCHEHRLLPHVVFESPSTSLVCELSGAGHGVGIAAQIAIPDSWYTREDLLLLPLKDEILSARIGLVSLRERQYAPFMTDFMKTAVSSIRDTYKRIDALRGR